MVREIKFIAEEVFKNSTEEDRLTQLEELFYQIVRRAELQDYIHSK